VENNSLSSIHQALGYCLAFKAAIAVKDTRQVIAALRERGTDNICWQTPFYQSAEEEIVAVVNHIHALLSGQAPFKPANNLNKCKGCRLNIFCDQHRG
jgi:CRISPR-associated exonuclease Cas4